MTISRNIYKMYYQNDNGGTFMEHGYAMTKETAVKMAAEFMYQYRNEGVKAGFTFPGCVTAKYISITNEELYIPTAGECNAALNA